MTDCGGSSSPGMELQFTLLESKLRVWAPAIAGRLNNLPGHNCDISTTLNLPLQCWAESGLTKRSVTVQLKNLAGWPKGGELRGFFIAFPGRHWSSDLESF